MLVAIYIEIKERKYIKRNIIVIKHMELQKQRNLETILDLVILCSISTGDSECI
jgi:hypothetical protein